MQIIQYREQDCDMAIKNSFTQKQINEVEAKKYRKQGKKKEKN